jgi:glycolate oxidase
LERYLTRRNVCFKREDLYCYGYDAALVGAAPDVVVFPQGREQVIELVRFARRKRIPVVARGAGTGCAGGALSVRGGILLSFERMNRILSIDADLRIGIVEPGVITADFQKVVEQQGLFYPPDPSSARICTLGGNAGHGAGGLRGRAFGTTGDYVIGTEAVTADGHLLRTGFFASAESVDLSGLLVGSEGTLACLVTMALRLLPRPESIGTLLLVFPDAAGALGTSQEILKQGLLPAALEYMDDKALRCVREHGFRDLPAGDGHVLIVELCGERKTIGRQAERVEKLARCEGSVSLRQAWRSREREDIWSVRRALSPAMAHAARRKFSQDVCVPPEAVGKLLERIADIGGRRGLTVIAFGHLGDGNIHVNTLSNGSPREERQALAAVEDVYRAVLSLQGTLTGEHGIGVHRMPYLSWELSPATLEAHRRVKAAFDPGHLMNPGKLADPPATRPASPAPGAETHNGGTYLGDA